MSAIADGRAKRIMYNPKARRVVVLFVCAFFGMILGGVVPLIPLLFAPQPYLLSPEVLSAKTRLNLEEGGWVPKGTVTWYDNNVEENPWKPLYHQIKLGFASTFEIKGQSVRAQFFIFDNEDLAKKCFKDANTLDLLGSKYKSRTNGIRFFKITGSGWTARFHREKNFIYAIEFPDTVPLGPLMSAVPFLRPNFHTNMLTRLSPILLGAKFLLSYIAIFFVLWFVFTSRLATWAGSLDPDPAVRPLDELSMRQRIFSLDNAETPFRVTAKGPQKFIIEWKMTDQNWFKQLSLSYNKVYTTYKLRLKLDPKKKIIYACDQLKNVRLRLGSDGMARYGFTFQMRFFIGIVFYHYNRAYRARLCFSKEGYYFQHSEKYSLELSEMKNPLIEAVLTGGWYYKPKMLII